MHDSEFRICDRLKCGYMFDHRSLQFRQFVFEHFCIIALLWLLVYLYVFFLFSFFAALVANKVIILFRSQHTVVLSSILHVHCNWYVNKCLRLLGTFCSSTVYTLQIRTCAVLTCRKENANYRSLISRTSSPGLMVDDVSTNINWHYMIHCMQLWYIH